MESGIVRAVGNKSLDISANVTAPRSSRFLLVCILIAARKLLFSSGDFVYSLVTDVWRSVGAIRVPWFPFHALTPAFMLLIGLSPYETAEKKD